MDNMNLRKLPDKILLQIIQLVELSEQQPDMIDYQEALDKIIKNNALDKIIKNNVITGKEVK